jgi:transglutaminase-like putative cysteine protease
MVKQKIDNRKLFIFAGVILIVVALFGTSKNITPASAVDGNWDISEQIAGQGFEEHLIEEIDFDYTDPQIQQIAEGIKSRTSTPYEAIKETATFVFQHIRYESDISVQQCYQGTATSALETAVGDCVDMTRLNVAILRAMGIPARSVGGCLKSTVRCSPLFSVFPGQEPQVTQMTDDDFKKRGFLHEWLEAYDPERGWLQVEATAGQVYGQECNQYIQFDYDTNQYNRCVITDRDFWQLCRVS